MEEMNKDLETSKKEGLEERPMDVIIDPSTGEHKILGDIRDNVDEVDMAFDNMVEKINSDNDSFLSDRPITDSDVLEYLSGDNTDDTLLGELSKGTNISDEAIKKLLSVTNRKLKGEKFNVYRELPEEIQTIIDQYVKTDPGCIGDISTLNLVRKNVADALLDEFIANIQIDRSKHDFVADMEQIYNSFNSEISDLASDYIEERNKAYREAADTIEDEDKKERLLSILDMIDNARDLTDLKKFAKNCKIKKFELEKPEKLFRTFLAKYKNSTNNIYDIHLAHDTLLRHLSQEGYTDDAVNAFLVAFCKQVKNYSVDNVLQHAYMYYVLYYCALIDSDKTKDKYLNSVKEVIDLLNKRNNIF